MDEAFLLGFFFPVEGHLWLTCPSRLETAFLLTMPVKCHHRFYNFFVFFPQKCVSVLGAF